jgi:hypothetical protein
MSNTLDAQYVKTMQFMSKYNYIIDVKMTDDGCFVTFPDVHILPCKYIQVSVVVNKNRATVKFTQFDNILTILSEQEIDVSTYAAYTLSVMYILRRCHFIQYNPLLVIYRDKENNIININDVIQYFPVQLSTYQCKKFQELENYVANILLNRQADNVDDTIKKNSDIILSVYNGEI